MTIKEELVKKIKENWFSSEEDLVNFLFDLPPELKEASITYCPDCVFCKKEIRQSPDFHVEYFCTYTDNQVLPIDFCSKAFKAASVSELHQDIRTHKPTKKEIADSIRLIEEVGNHKMFIGGDEE